MDVGRQILVREVELNFVENQHTLGKFLTGTH